MMEATDGLGASLRPGQVGASWCGWRGAASDSYFHAFVFVFLSVS